MQAFNQTLSNGDLTMSTIIKEFIPNTEQEQYHTMRAMIRSIETIQDSVNQSVALCSLSTGKCQDTYGLMLSLLQRIKGQCDNIELTVLDEMRGYAENPGDNAAL